MTHPMVGWWILSPLLRDMPKALHIVRSHHERFDGRGLTDGLAGDAIPIEVRIAAVADTFDAMTSARPYRPGVPLNAALAELRRCAGAQFDPQVVSDFVAVVEGGQVDALTVTDSTATSEPAPRGARSGRTSRPCENKTLLRGFDWRRENKTLLCAS